jgi:DNA recombination protein RmuC
VSVKLEAHKMGRYLLLKSIHSLPMGGIMNSFQILLIFSTGFVLGSFLFGLWFHQKAKTGFDRGVASSAKDVAVIQEKLAASERESQSWQSKCGEHRIEINRKTDKISELELVIVEKKVSLAQLGVRLTEDHRLMEEKLSFINDSREQLKHEFQVLAGQIIDERSKIFTAQNKDNLDLVLSPLREQLKDFKSKVEDVYVKESEGRAALVNEIGHLKNISLQMSTDADNLAQALKGDNKAQGQWGECILERVLEMSGLERGREFETQFHTLDANGGCYIPDAVVHLPHQRDVVVDSKVSLSDYEAYCSAVSDAERSDSLKNHLQSIRRHIQNLSGKQYDQLPEIHSLDYVLLFIPIEAAFVAALKADNTLFSDAFTKNIILVCPSTLLVTLKVIGFTWRIQQQTDNAQVIAHKAADLYDKFCQFLGVLQEVGESIKKASTKYDSAIKIVSTGKGNLIKRAEEFKGLGIKGKKEIPVEFLELPEPLEEISIPEVK